MGQEKEFDEKLEQRGVSRRDFMKYCTFLTASGLALHMEASRRPNLIPEGTKELGIHFAKFNDGTSWPVEAGHPCIGCSEPEFWDKMSSFYEAM